MGIFDKAKDMAGEHPEAVDSGIDKAADFADDRTGNKYTEQIDQGSEEVKERMGEWAGPEEAPPPPA